MRFRHLRVPCEFAIGAGFVLGNLTNVDYPGTVIDITLKYDLLDRLTNVVDASGTTAFAYNNANQL